MGTKGWEKGRFRNLLGDWNIINQKRRAWRMAEDEQIKGTNGEKEDKTLTSRDK